MILSIASFATAHGGWITAIPEVLRLVGIDGAILTINAIGARKATAVEILDGEANHVLAGTPMQKKA